MYVPRSLYYRIFYDCYTFRNRRVNDTHTEDCPISSASVMQKKKSSNHSRGISFLWWIISEIQLSKLWRTKRVQTVDFCLVCVGVFFLSDSQQYCEREKKPKIKGIICFVFSNYHCCASVAKLMVVLMSASTFGSMFSYDSCPRPLKTNCHRTTNEQKHCYIEFEDFKWKFSFYKKNVIDFHHLTW